MSKKTKIAAELDSNWFAELLEMFIPSDANIEGKTTKQLINSASKKAFAISFTAAIPPGFFGWATILPELIMITKIQLNLIYAIAKHYNQTKNVNITLMAIIFGNALGIELGRGILKKAGVEIFVSRISRQLLKPILENISVKTIARIIAKVPARWVPLAFAPIFGIWSYTNTKAIGWQADKLFSNTIKFVDEDLSNSENIDTSNKNNVDNYEQSMD